MFDSFICSLTFVEEYVLLLGVIMIIIPGLVLSVKNHFFQFKVLSRLKRCVRDLKECNEAESHGIHPLKLYFASIGGMIGLGNVVSVVTAVTVGGPGALFWLWVAAFLGMIIKYSEIYLGLKFRQKNNSGSYDGGPMYFLKEAFNNNFIPKIVALLLCFYAVEIYQFTVVVDTIQRSFDVNRYFAIACLLAIVMWAAIGGVKRLSNICVLLMPPFVISYILMCLWVILDHASEIPQMLLSVFYSAFNGHAATGGFLGATFIIAAQQGVARGIYAGDIGIGFDSIIQSASKTKHPERQARMGIFSLLTGVIVCTMTLLTVLLSGLWKVNGTNMLASEYMTKILGQYFPFINIYMLVLFFLAAFTTLLAYYAVGRRTARFLSPTHGIKIYTVYAILAFSFFSHFDQTVPMSLMAICSVLLVTFNIAGMLKLRRHIKYI
ncbi:MAG: amino acid carrier protein [Proteobacteria bacterium]|nr:amino acid carrier protein [Pseudomonadota bacterium]